MRTLKLRGLPFSATVAHIKNFLGEHVQYVEDDSCIYIVHNRDGRSSGLAEIIFMTSTAAQKCQEEKHMQKMFVETVPLSANIVQERYIEVFLREDRLLFEHFHRQRSMFAVLPWATKSRLLQMRRFCCRIARVTWNP